LEHKQLTLAKGLVQTTLSREAVDFVLKNLDLDKTIGQLDQPGRYGIDEWAF
jgi:hypothetical protein